MDENQLFENWKECRKSADYSNIKKELNIESKPPTKIINLIHSIEKRPKSSKNITEKNLKISKTTFNKHKKQNEENIISFQLINIETVEASVNFTLPPSILSIFREFNVKYIKEEQIWIISFQKYSSLYKAIQNINDLKIILKPIPILSIDFICQNNNITLLKFLTQYNEKEKKKITFIIDYSKDIKHSINELPNKLQNTLYDFQKEGINFGIEKNGRLLIADEMGVGKTIQAIGIMTIYKDDWPVLILCPSSVKFSWRDELKNWLSDIINLDKEDIQVFKTSKDKIKNGEKFYIISYDLAIRNIDILIEKKFKCAIADEAHYMKNFDSKRTKLLIPILQRCKRLILLTGTPILAKPVEIYPLLTALRPDFFHNFKEFGERFCNPTQTIYGMNWNGYDNIRELHFILKKIMIRRLKNDVLSQLPPKKRQKIEIQTDQKILNQIKKILQTKKERLKKFLNSTDNKTEKEEEKNISNEKSSENILSTLNEAYTLTGKAKIKGITDYITYLINNSCKFLIFAHHTEVLNSIEETVKKTKTEYVRIDGQVTSEKKQEKVNKFQKDNSCLVAILGITACATGITLTKASTIIFAELHYTPAIMIQAEDRAHRIGQENNCVNIHYLFASDTLDEIIYNKLNEKFMIVSSTMDNQVKDLEMKKIKEKIGEFVKVDGKEVSIDKRKSVVLGSIKNKTLNEFLVSKNMNIHDNNCRRNGDVVKLEFDDNKNNDGKENDNGSNDSINKFFEI